MPLTISNNSAVASASYYLDKNQKHLQDSIKRLASGKKIVGANEDPGTLSVAMKLNAAVNRLSGARIMFKMGSHLLRFRMVFLKPLVESSGEWPSSREWPPRIH